MPPDNVPEVVERTGAPPGLTKRALGGMIWTFSGTGIQGAIQMLVLMVLGRLLTPNDFGLMGAAVVVIALSQIVSQVGVGPAIVQRKELDDIHLRVAFTISGVLGFVLGAIVYFGAPAIADFYRIPAVEPVLRAIAFLFPIDGLNTVSQALLTRQLRFRAFIGLDVGSYILGYAVVGVFLAWEGWGVWALVTANLAQVTLRTIFMYIGARHPLKPSLNYKASHDLLSFGFGHSLAQIGTVLSQQGDNMVVGRWLGAAALGIYGRAYNLMVMPATVFGKIVNRVLFPVMSQVQDERERLAGAYERALAIVGLLSLAVSAFLWVVAPEFIVTLLGPKWTGVVLPFRLFTIGLLFRMSSKISDACTKAAGAVYSRALLQGSYAAAVLLGAWIGQHWGVGGVAIAVSIAMCGNWLTMAALGRSVTGLSWTRFVQAHVPGALFAALIGVSVAIPVHFARAAHLGKVPILVVASITALAVTYAVSKAESRLLLGTHGNWAFRQVGQFLRQVFSRIGRVRTGAPDALAKANPE
ncbi:MAG TPA: lipopolysaccharide biosynthesis protein [Gemmatimonadales bacterium]|jgi:PST family polysaccharide transporter